MRAFLDFEATSLGKQGVPVEVAWVFEDGAGEGYLIRPAPQWSDWDPRAEAIHGISREHLEREGVPHDVVAARMVQALDGHDLYASAPSWDGKWLSALLRAAGLPRHRLRLRDSEVADAEAARGLLASAVADKELDGRVAEVLARVAIEFAARPVRHRALDDAEEERQRWLAATRHARNLLRESRTSRS